MVPASCTFRLPAFLLLVVIGRASIHAQQLWNGGTCELCSGTALCSTWEGTIFPPAMAAKMPPMPQLGGDDATTQRFVEFSIFPESTDVEAIRADPTILNGRKPLHIVRVDEDTTNKNICTVLVNNKGCKSCSVCANGAYTVDCTNLSNGLALTCDTHTVLFPLRGLAATGTTTASKEEEVPTTGGAALLPKVPAPTKAPTKVPTKAPMKAPTKAPTEAPATAPTKWPVRAPSKWPVQASAPSSKWPVRAPPTKWPAVVRAPSKWPVMAPMTMTTASYPVITTNNTTAVATSMSPVTRTPATKAPATDAPVNAGPPPVTTTNAPVVVAAAVDVVAKAAAATASTEEEELDDDPISVPPPSTSGSDATNASAAAAIVHSVVVLAVAVLLLPS